MIHLQSLGCFVFSIVIVMLVLGDVIIWWFRISQGRIPAREVLLAEGWDMNRMRIRGFLVFSTLWRFTCPMPNRPNVGKYTIHWASGMRSYSIHFFFQYRIFFILLNHRRPTQSVLQCIWSNYSIIIATSHDLTPNGGWVREIPLLQGNLAWWNFMFSWCSFIAHVVLHVFCFFFGVKTVKRIPCLRNPDPAVFNTNQYFGVSHGVATEPTGLPKWWLTERHETTFRRPRKDDMKSLKRLPSN